jgi:uncharacterized membrane protein
MLAQSVYIHSKCVSIYLFTGKYVKRCLRRALLHFQVALLNSVCPIVQKVYMHIKRFAICLLVNKCSVCIRESNYKYAEKQNKIHKKKIVNISDVPILTWQVACLDGNLIVYV